MYLSAGANKHFIYGVRRMTALQTKNQNGTWETSLKETRSAEHSLQTRGERVPKAWDSVTIMHKQGKTNPSNIIKRNRGQRKAKLVMQGIIGMLGETGVRW